MVITRNVYTYFVKNIFLNFHSNLIPVILVVNMYMIRYSSTKLNTFETNRLTIS